MTVNKMQTKYFLNIALDKELCQLIQMMLQRIWLVAVIKQVVCLGQEEAAILANQVSHLSLECAKEQFKVTC